MIYTISFTTIAIALVLAAMFCFVANRSRWLSGSGAIAAFCLAAIILLSGNLAYAIPMLVFFIGGSLLSRLPSKAVNHDVKAKKARDAMQVFCNGGVAGICMLLLYVTGNNCFIAAYFFSIAVSAADTASSEFGNFFRGQVYNIVSFNAMPKGLSGGISLQGTVAGLIAAAFIACCYALAAPLNRAMFVAITSVGFAGMLLDSVLGSLLQAKYINADNTVAEANCGSSARLYKGVAWMNNDLVNLVSNAIVTAIATILFFS